MALSFGVIFDVRTTGSDTANGGAFDPTVTAGMFTDGAATVATSNAPVFTSASYAFVAGDVGAWVFIASGTNWTAGWYQIASVSAGAATLTATINTAAMLRQSTPAFLNTVAGCATVASPTGATWTIDYSQQDTARFSYTDLASAGAGLTVSSAATPFGRQMVGNMLVIASGTNFTAGNYIIASVAAVTFIATVTGAANITTGAGASGVGGQGGAMATPGKAGSKRVAGNKTFIKSGTYTNTSATLNVAGGGHSITTAGTVTNINAIIGWSSERTLWNMTTSRPLISFGSVTTATAISTTATFTISRNLVIDGNAQTGSTCYNCSGNYQLAEYIEARNWRLRGFNLDMGAASVGYRLLSTGGQGTDSFQVGGSSNGGLLMYCESYANATHGFNLASATAYRCAAYNNTGAGSVGFFTSFGYTAIECVAYNNQGGGFNPTGVALHIGCIAESNGGLGWLGSAVRFLSTLINCGGYNNTGGNFTAANYPSVINFISNTTGTFFVDAANGNFNLNNTANQGALARGANYVLFPRGITESFDDLGAAQTLTSGPSGAVNPFNGVIVSM
jgi:hypothetical protein